MAHLFDPLKLRGVEFANRIVVSPMCQYSCVDGFATDWHFVHLGSRAVGRAAAVIAEATAITADSRISPQDLGIWTDAHIEPLAARIFFYCRTRFRPGHSVGPRRQKGKHQPALEWRQANHSSRRRMDAHFRAQRIGLYRRLSGSASSHRGRNRLRSLKLLPLPPAAPRQQAQN